MRTDIPSGLQSHLETRETTLCWCWRITKTDNTVLGFTNHDRDLTFGSVTYEASTGFLGTEIESQLGMSVDNMDVYGAVDSVNISEADIEAGLYDNAEIEVYLVNWSNSASRTFTWDDVFQDHTRYGGEDWGGYGTAELTAGHEALEWFIGTYLSTINPGPARLELTSPTGELYLGGRVDFQGINDLVIDLGNTEVLRFRRDYFWGILYVWGTESTVGGAIRIQGASAGDTTIVLDEPAHIQVGYVLSLRTDATAPGYHPFENRETLIVTGVSGNTLTLSVPLAIDAPYENPLNFPGETLDPSTVTRLVGGTLVADADAGDSSILIADTAGITAGDWMRVATSELPTYQGNQFTHLDSQIDQTEEFGDIPINEELLQVASVFAGTVTFTRPLEKNKLTAWSAFAHKIDPCENVHILGGDWKGITDQGGEDPWKHQYIWARYNVGGSVRGCTFDTDATIPLVNRRMGQAVRYDTGYGNLVEDITVGRGAGIDAGEAYGVSLRRGEAHSTVRYSHFTNCRHSVELWSTSGGCIVEYNTATNGTSSDFDTHGSWNTGVTIRHNYATNDGLLLSSDLGGLPDAIRVGNNKFIFDENVTITDNRVEAYRGNALSIVPAARDVTATGLHCIDVDRVLSILRNSRHPLMYAENISVSAVLSDGTTDRLIEVSHSDGNTVVDGLTLFDWDSGVNGTAGTTSSVTAGVRILNASDVDISGFRLKDLDTPTFGYGFSFRDSADVTFYDSWQQSGERFLDIRNVTNFSGTGLQVHDLTAAAPYTVNEVGTCTGSVTLEYVGFTPATNLIALSYTGTLDAGSLDTADQVGGQTQPSVFDYTDPVMDISDYPDRVTMKKGNLGEVRRGKTMFQTEVRGISNQLQQVKGRTYQYACDALLGDSRCKKSLTGSTYTGTSAVASTNGYSSLTTSGLGSYANGWFSRGKLTFTSGNNDGIVREVKTHFNTDGVVTISLWEPTPFEIAASDTFSITAGCDKLFKTCKSKFSNGDNFRGFPHTPGSNTVIQYASTGDPNFDGGGNFVGKD